MAALSADLPLDRVIDEGVRLGDARGGLEGGAVVLGEGRLLVERTTATALYDPQVGIGGLDEGQPFLEVAAIETVHGEDDGEQQSDAKDCGNESAAMLLQIMKCQVHACLNHPSAQPGRRAAVVPSCRARHLPD